MSRLYDLAASALRTLDPEDAHRLTVRALTLGLGPGAPAPDPILATTIAGLSLSSALGLAAGFDKNAEVFGIFGASAFVVTGAAAAALFLFHWWQAREKRSSANATH